MWYTLPAAEIIAMLLQDKEKRMLEDAVVVEGPMTNTLDEGGSIVNALDEVEGPMAALDGGKIAKQ